MKKKLNSNLRISQSQKIVMLPRMQQAIRLLSLPLHELNNEINAALVENPLLEIEEDFIEEDKDVKSDSDNQEAPAMEDFEGVMEEVDIEWDSQSESFETSFSESNLLDKVSESPHGKTLADHLMWQLGMEELSEEDYLVAFGIIHNLLAEGLLETPLEKLAQTEKWDRQQAFKIRTLIQHLDPLGCGSDNWQECILFQAKVSGYESPLLESIVREYSNKQDQLDCQRIASELGVDRSEVAKALQILKELNPSPGLLISNKPIPYIAPDVYVIKHGDKYIIKVNEEEIPTLKISQSFGDILSSDKEKNKQAADYIQEKTDGAKWIINAIHRRKKTLHQVADAIVSRQQEFFKQGKGHLKPMILKDIANEIDVHESTVSRAVTNKYMHTPKGVFELKYFFKSPASKKVGVGGVVTASAVHIKIRGYIDSEDPTLPISDQRITELLKRDGITLARRTVAKYRVALGIPAVSKRKGRKVEEVG